MDKNIVSFFEELILDVNRSFKDDLENDRLSLQVFDDHLTVRIGNREFLKIDELYLAHYCFLSELCFHFLNFLRGYLVNDTDEMPDELEIEILKIRNNHYTYYNGYIYNEDGLILDTRFESDDMNEIYEIMGEIIQKKLCHPFQDKEYWKYYTVDDNPFYSQDYEYRLKTLPPYLRRKFLGY